MHNIYDSATVQEINQRINQLTPASQAQWGKMNVAQMMAHAAIPLEIALGERTSESSLFARIIGPLARKIATDQKPFKRSLPTNPDFVVADEKNFDIEKARLAGAIHRFSMAGAEKMNSVRHPFFGKLTGHEWSNLMVKHLDHHLRQFGA